MCYSAQIEAAYQKLVRMNGATVSLQEFAVLYARDPGKKRPKTPKRWRMRSATAPTRQSGQCGP